nr:immunoglobulin heavy chain junction region [Mus musculus]
CTGGLFAYW